MDTRKVISDLTTDTYKLGNGSYLQTCKASSFVLIYREIPRDDKNTDRHIITKE